MAIRYIPGKKGPSGNTEKTVENKAPLGGGASIKRPPTKWGSEIRAQLDEVDKRETDKQRALRALLQQLDTKKES